jgi:NAD(P)-dependent dehydrogenase (short-subunit alcohol dehydrogenase family)
LWIDFKNIFGETFMEKTDRKTVVITGSTRGIGFGLAEAFLKQGCAVVISSRTASAVEKALESLKDEGEVLGQVCDVARFHDVQTLWDVAKAHYGRVDIWINNAGIAHPMEDFWNLPEERMAELVETNILGTMHGSKVAIQGFLAQGGGALYNMLGFGANGKGTMRGMSLYGTSKAALSYLTKSLVAEVKNTPVIVGTISPGMVLTEMVTGQYAGKPEDLEKAKRIFNLIASKVDEVAPAIAAQVLENRMNGKRIKFFTMGKMMGRMAKAAVGKRKII